MKPLVMMNCIQKTCKCGSQRSRKNNNNEEGERRRVQKKKVSMRSVNSIFYETVLHGY